MDFKEDFQDYLNENLGYFLVNFFIFLGLIKFIKWIWTFLCSMCRQIFRPCFQSKTRIYQNYGVKDNLISNSWALVTGGSDGIGLAMAKKLAKEGFNIIIAARNEKKINEKFEEIRKECRDGDDSFKTLAVIADFQKLRTLDEYKKIIGEKVEDLDVAVVVLCAGYATLGPFIDISDDEIEKLMQINANHMVYSAKTLVNQLVKRYDTKGKKSALVVISAMMALVPASGATTYAASKSFTSYMAEGLNYELQGKVDVISYQPAGVATKMIGQAKAKTMPGLISPEHAANCCFRDLGHRAVTKGAFSHEIVGLAFANLPHRLFQTAIFKKSKEELKNFRERDQQVADANKA